MQRKKTKMQRQATAFVRESAGYVRTRVRSAMHRLEGYLGVLPREGEARMHLQTRAHGTYILAVYVHTMQ